MSASSRPAADPHRATPSFVAGRQLADTSWRFVADAATGSEVQDPALAARFAMLADAMAAARRTGGDALPWRVAMQMAHAPDVPGVADPPARRIARA